MTEILKLGDVVFFKRVTKEIRNKKTPEIGFKENTGFGVMLGVIPPFTPPPTVGHLMALMGQAGYISFDDVGHFFGEENLKVCIQKFQDKYNKPPEPEKSKLILPPPTRAPDEIKAGADRAVDLVMKGIDALEVKPDEMN